MNKRSVTSTRALDFGIKINERTNGRIEVNEENNNNKMERRKKMWIIITAQSRRATPSILYF